MATGNFVASLLHARGVADMPTTVERLNLRPGLFALLQGGSTTRTTTETSSDNNKFYISSKYLLPPQRRLRSFLGVTLKGDLVDEADGGLRSCPIPF